MNTHVNSLDSGPLANDVTTDVCVIGAGIAGLMTAQRLLEQGHSVIVLEQNEVGSGETGRTTAHLTAMLDSSYSELEREHGQDGALLAAESHLAGIDEIERVVRKLAIACEFQRLDAYLYAAEPGSSDELDDELLAARRAGLSVEKIDHLPLPFASGPALCFARQAELHALKFLDGLVGGIERHGGRIFLHTHVEGIETGAPVVVHTATGPKVRANAVVVATNTPINSMFSMHTKQAWYRTYAIAGAVLRGVLAKGLYWDTEDPYHYVRLASAPQAGSLPDHEWLIVGGEDHKVGQADDPKASWTRLESWTRSRFPMLESVVFRWSGQVCEPADGLGFVGLSPGAENVYLITGHSGNGTTYAALGAILLSDLIAGKPNRWSLLYDPSRKPLGRSGIARFAHENLNVARRYGDWLTRGTANSVHTIARGEGAVVRRGLKKLAVYVDENGVSHERSAVCTHLGCIVNWNGAEKSWDCPCHGSRFDCYGKLLMGPAPRDLEPVGKPDRPEPSEERIGR